MHSFCIIHTHKPIHYLSERFLMKPDAMFGKHNHFGYNPVPVIKETLNQWDRLIKYQEDGRLKPYNNLVGNAIRPFVVGRKTWLFSGRPEGASASSVLYSLIETAKANDLEPYQYLRYLFEKLPLAETDKDYAALLPYHIEKADLLAGQ